MKTNRITHQIHLFNSHNTKQQQNKTKHIKVYTSKQNTEKNENQTSNKSKTN